MPAGCAPDKKDLNIVPKQSGIHLLIQGQGPKKVLIGPLGHALFTGTCICVGDAPGRSGRRGPVIS